MQGEPSGCVLFADVSGSTKLYEIVGDEAARAAIDLCVKLFSAVAEQHGGRVAKTVDDEVMAVFPEPAAAARAAVDIQLSVSRMAPVDKVKLGARIGLSCGSLAERDGEFHGEAVNIAWRLTELASKGQILLSAQTAASLEPMQFLDCRRLHDMMLGGGDRPAQVWEMGWSDSEDNTTNADTQPPAGTGLRLVYRSRVLHLGGERTSMALGRDEAADLVVPDRLASRTHCVIERRHGKYYLVDRSANGTYLTIDGDREMVLRGEETMLRRHGVIALGQSRANASELVEFFCE